MRTQGLDAAHAYDHPPSFDSGLSLLIKPFDNRPSTANRYMAETTNRPLHQDWKTLFATPRTIDPKAENSPFLEDLVGTTTSDDGLDNSDCESISDDPNHQWMRLDLESVEGAGDTGSGEAGSSRTMAGEENPVYSFFPKLRADGWKRDLDAERRFSEFFDQARVGEDGCVCFIDDRNIERRQCGKFDRKLTVKEFREALQKNVSI